MKKLILLLIIFLLLAIFIKVADNYFSERVEIYIIKQADNLASNAIKDIVLESVVPNIDMDEIILFKYQENNNIDSIVVNTKIVNKIMGEASILVDEILDKRYLEKELNKVKLPLGFVISPTFFASFGPNIKVNIEPIGAYSVDTFTNIEPFGINNTLIEVYLSIRIDIEALIPLQKKGFTSNTKVYLISQVVQGEIPKYYYSTPNVIDYIPENTD